jgi:hypothetical protein
MTAQELPLFRERENSKLFAFYILNGNKNTMKKLPATVYRLANIFLYLNWLKKILKKRMPKERRY